MTVGALSRPELRSLLAGGGVPLRIGPFLARVRSSLPAVEESLATLYTAHPVEREAAGAHFDIRADSPNLLRRLVRPQVQLTIDGRQPFIPLPLSMAAPMLEAGLNWCIGTRAHHLLAIHAATLARGGRALIMPAPPGSGKSTLCAALVLRGWRLLSDEFALIDPADGRLRPVPRPIALKNASIGLIRALAPGATFSREAVNNEGETVSYLRPPDASVSAANEPCEPGWIVIPEFRREADVEVVRLTRARALLHLGENAFNHDVLGPDGFERLAGIAEAAPCVRLRYSSLEDGIRAVEEFCT